MATINIEMSDDIARVGRTKREISDMENALDRIRVALIDAGIEAF